MLVAAPPGNPLKTDEVCSLRSAVHVVHVVLPLVNVSSVLVSLDMNLPPSTDLMYSPPFASISNTSDLL